MQCIATCDCNVSEIYEKLFHVQCFYHFIYDNFIGRTAMVAVFHLD